MSVSKFKKFVEEITVETGRLYKMSVLEKYKNDEDIKYYLNFLYNPYITTGLSRKKLNKVVDTFPGILLDGTDDKEIFEYIRTSNTGRDVDILAVQEYRSTYIPGDCKLVFDSLITKDMPLGIDAKTINKVIPGLIPEFNVMLAEKYFECPEYVEGKEFALTEKIDGCRIVAIKENDNISFYTRQGQTYDGLVDLESEMKSMPDCVLDGELTLLDPGELTSGEQYKATTKLCRTKYSEKHGLKMLVFDYMPISMFKEQKCSLSYNERRSYLENMFSGQEFKYFNLLPILYKGTDTSMIAKLLNKQVAAGHEGVMINICDATYKFKRTKDLLKCKLFNTADLRIVGMEAGTNKYQNTLGALLLEYKNGNIVKCGSGFTDWQRDELWNNQDEYIDTIVEVSYFEKTTNADGGESLRFPIFRDFRPDKNEPNYD